LVAFRGCSNGNGDGDPDLEAAFRFFYDASFLNGPSAGAAGCAVLHLRCACVGCRPLLE
jgi:hypothetical protein